MARTQDAEAGPAHRFLIWGGGGHGKVVADVVRAAGGAVLGYVDRDATKRDAVAEPGGARVISLDEEAQRRLDSTGELPGGANAVALGIGDNRARMAVYGRLSGCALPALIHPSAVVSPSARIGAGSVVMPGAVLNAGCVVGEGCIVNTRAVVEHDCMVGDGAHLSPGAILAGGARVGALAWIGAGATVIEGVQVGEAVVVGAGAVVIRDLPDGVTAVGVPARALLRSPSGA